MRTSKYIAAIGLIISSSAFSLEAQDTILNRSVSVEREYRPVIQDAGKINSVPQVLEPSVVKTPATYSDFNLPLNADYNIHTLAAAELAPEKPNNKEGFARIGLGNYLNTLVDFAYPVINTPDIKLDFSLNHLATFDTKQMHSTTKAALSFDKLFKTFDLYAGVGGGHEYFKYYGDNFNRDSVVDLSNLAVTKGYNTYIEMNPAGVNAPRLFNLNMIAGEPNGETFWRFNSTIGVRSLPLSTDLHYLAEVHYNIFSSLNGLTENNVHTKASFNSPNQKNRMGIDLDMNNMMYNSTGGTQLNFWNNYTVLMLNPYYSIERENWNVRLGLKAAFSFVHGNFINPSADVVAEWKPFPKFLSIYGGLTGDYKVNTLDKIYSENPYLFSGIRVNDTYSPSNLFAGIKLKIVYNLLVDAYVDFRQINNQYFFVNKEYLQVNPALTSNPSADSYLFTDRFNVIYSNATLFKTGVRMAYNYQNTVDVELKGAINNWTVSTEPYAWNKPKYEAELNVGVKINPNLSVSANAYYEGGRFAKLGTLAVPMSDKVDINLGVSYKYNSWLTAFGKINNLINNQFQNFYGYDVQGTNLMIGAAFTF